MAERIGGELGIGKERAQKVLLNLASKNEDLIADFESEMERANREYEKSSLANNVSGIVALTNELSKVRKEIEARRSNPFGFGELFAMTDAAWSRARKFEVPNDLIAAIRLRRELTCCRLVMLTGLEMLADEDRAPNVHLAEARRLVADIDRRLIPNCKSNGVDMASEDCKSVVCNDLLGRRLVECGYWEAGKKKLCEAADGYDRACADAIVSQFKP